MTNQIQELTHSNWGGSTLKRRFSCLASARMEASLPSTTNPDARVGTVCHKLVEDCLNDASCKPADYRDIPHQVDGHDVKLTPEHINQVEVAIERTKEIFAEAGAGQTIKWGTELAVDFSDWCPTGRGYCDLYLIQGTTLTVLDYKFGRYAVDAYRNPQLMAYALGAYSEFELLHDIDTINLVIVQPPIDSVSRDTLSLQELLEFGEQLRDVYTAAQDPDAEYNPSEDNCKYCKAAANCPALVQAAVNPVLDQRVSADNFVDLNSLTAEEVGSLLTRVPLVVDFYKSLQNYATTALLAGENIPGWKLVQGRAGNTAWSVTEDELPKKLRGKVKKADLYQTKLKSPTQLKKLIEPDLFAELTHRPPGNPMLAPESDKRPSMDLVNELFKGVKNPALT